MTSKEVLKDIRERLYHETIYAISKGSEIKIEYNLRRNEDIYNFVDNIIGVSFIRKDLEILEIIKKKKVNLLMFEYVFINWNKDYNFYSQDYENPYSNFNISNGILTETEFNLIKEWLKDESRRND